MGMKLLEQNNDGENVPFFFSIRNQIITATQKLKFNFVKEIQNNQYRICTMVHVCLVLLGKISLFLVDYTYNHDRLKAYRHEISHEYEARKKEDMHQLCPSLHLQSRKNTFNLHVQCTKIFTDIQKLPPNSVLSLGMLFVLGLPLFGLALTDLDSAALYCIAVSDDRTFGSILSNL